MSNVSDHHSWQWFGLPVATLGYAILLSSQPHQFPGLYTIALVVYLLGVAEYIVVSAIIILNLIKTRPSISKLFLNPYKVIRRAAIWIATSSLIGGAHQLARPATNSPLSTCLFVLFWVYFAGAIIDVCTALLIIIESRHHLEAREMTPSWLLPLLPSLLCGTLSSILSASLNADHRIPVLVAGLTGMGMGFLLSLSIFAVFLNRLYQSGFPPVSSRFEMFVAVSPPAFLASNIVAMSREAPPGFINIANATDILQVLALVIGIFIWGLAIIFFVLAILSILLQVGNIRFSFAWYTASFPIVGLILATINIADGLGSDSLAWAASVLTILLGMFILFTYFIHIKKMCLQWLHSRQC